MSKFEAVRTLRVVPGGAGGYEVTFAPLAHLPGVLALAGVAPGRCIVVTDENVGGRYATPVHELLESAGYSALSITLPPGETTKSADHLAAIYDTALDWGIERSTLLLALGGGVIGDLAGFAAATLLRGLPLVQIPTTLVAQVDSAIGGKTGINHPAGKNLIGAFHQPRAVLADTSLLLSLPEREWTSGLAEVVKHGLIADADLFGRLEAAWDDLQRRDPGVVDRLVPDAARVKTRVVTEDELEAGRRAILNFGHTFAHAIEKVSGYGTFTHGEAVAAGMRAALHLSERLHPDLDRARADRLVSRIPVPAGLADLALGDLMAAMRSDKKVRGGRIRFVLLDRIGHAYVTDDVPGTLVEDAWTFARAITG